MAGTARLDGGSKKNHCHELNPSSPFRSLLATLRTDAMTKVIKKGMALIPPPLILWKEYGLFNVKIFKVKLLI